MAAVAEPTVHAATLPVAGLALGAQAGDVLARLKAAFQLTSAPRAPGCHAALAPQSGAPQPPAGPIADGARAGDACGPGRDQAPKQHECPLTAFNYELLDSLYEDEPKGAVDARYLARLSPDVDAHRRLALVDWLVEVVDEFKLAQSTLFAAVRLVDRFLSAAAVPRRELPLLGTAALWLACKFEEVYPPTLSDFIDIGQHAWTPADVTRMERRLLVELRFTLLAPTAHTFLVALLPAAAANAADADNALSIALDDGDDATGGGGGGGGGAASSGSGTPPGGCGDSGSGDGGDCSMSGRDSLDSTGASGGGCGGSGGSVGGSVGGCAGRFAAATQRPPAADAATGPRAAPRYPYPAGSPCPPPRASGAGAACGRGALALAPPPALAPGALGDFARRVAHMAEYVLELSLLSPEALRFPPSLLAAAALHFACRALGAPPGARGRLAPAAVRAGGGAALADAEQELTRMFVYAARAPQPPLTRAKFAAPARSGVAALPVPRWMEP